MWACQGFFLKKIKVSVYIKLNLSDPSKCVLFYHLVNWIYCFVYQLHIFAILLFICGVCRQWIVCLAFCSIILFVQKRGPPSGSSRMRRMFRQGKMKSSISVPNARNSGVCKNVDCPTMKRGMLDFSGTAVGIPRTMLLSQSSDELVNSLFPQQIRSLRDSGLHDPNCGRPKQSRMMHH